MLTSIKSIEVSDPALACRFPYQQDLYLQQLLTISDFYFFVHRDFYVYVSISNLSFSRSVSSEIGTSTPRNQKRKGMVATPIACKKAMLYYFGYQTYGLLETA